MPAAESLKTLTTRRQHIQNELATLGDFWPGTLSQERVKCGKSNCRCAQPGEPGHPCWILTRTVKGKTRSRSIPAAEAETTGKLVEKS